MEKGSILTSKEVIKDLLKTRFGKNPRRIMNQIQKIDNLRILKDLFHKALKVQSLDEFDMTMADILKK